jgi:hypothetical protein
MNFRKRFWIRGDREPYFLSGVIMTCFIAGFVSVYWHFSDRLAVKRNIKIYQRDISKKQESQKLKESQFYSPKSQSGARQYYKLEKKSALPRIPDTNEAPNEN